MHHHVTLECVEGVVDDVRQPSCRHTEGKVANGNAIRSGGDIFRRAVTAGRVSRVSHLSLLKRRLIVNDGTTGRQLIQTRWVGLNRIETLSSLFLALSV